jgi:hypothetical protein
MFCAVQGRSQPHLAQRQLRGVFNLFHHRADSVPDCHEAGHRPYSFRYFDCRQHGNRHDHPAGGVELVFGQRYQQIGPDRDVNFSLAMVADNASVFGTGDLLPALDHLAAQDNGDDVATHLPCALKPGLVPGFFISGQRGLTFLRKNGL